MEKYTIEQIKEKEIWVKCTGENAKKFLMAKKFKRNRKEHRSDEVTELPYKVFEEKLKKAGVDKYVIRVNKKRKGV